jgi:Tfp pilus assembly protein PilF
MDRIAQLKEFLTRNPQDSFLQHALALEHLKRGEEAAARSLFESLLQRDPGYVGSYYHLARLLERQNDRAAALHWYEAGMQQARDKNDTHAYNELRAAYEDLAD